MHVAMQRGRKKNLVMFTHFFGFVLGWRSYTNIIPRCGTPFWPGILRASREWPISRCTLTYLRYGNLFGLLFDVTVCFFISHRYSFHPVRLETTRRLETWIATEIEIVLLLLEKLALLSRPYSLVLLYRHIETLQQARGSAPEATRFIAYARNFPFPLTTTKLTFSKFKWILILRLLICVEKRNVILFFRIPTPLPGFTR